MLMNQMQSLKGRIKIQEFYENIQQLQLNQLQAKCSHNSFSQSDYYRQLAFNDQKLQQGGCLMLEFDLALKQADTDNQNEKYTIYVAHDENEKPQYTLAHDLKSVYNYHADYPQHLPIFITLNFKSWILDFDLESDKFYQSLEKTLTSVFRLEDIYQPNHQLQGEDNLFYSIQKYGQPQISEMLGKMVFILDAEQYNLQNNQMNSFYQSYHSKINDKLMFVTFDARLVQNKYYTSIQDYYNKTGNMNQIFVNIRSHYSTSSIQYKIGLSVLEEAKQLNLVTRGYLLNTESLYKMYKGLGMNFLCTDKLFDTNYTIPI
ncbi:PLC-like phosphodiesterase, TIM beta/alpha-barrel domain [Pseudocohnilembus persalinus]|uniref:PLC-like phosphodiesterase, TIM beta/alpha-barrel domain n=1 Tax=Pseudocohnilembus persalinus TaxID=266149 RepID=A0A0V0QYS6_PSEPJ|nr:PLC-like phosphodiesterase, TIM beta/alpha-barrel domain [Pseudocohnilembus persalinus]|eukprot:KRX07497.1 PLC-like phosphodiesterase, TIM beta/alpha-barrel domain [Pseudocohnilembus persalinus]